MKFSQEKMYWVEKLLQEKEDTLEYAITRDKLIKMHILLMIQWLSLMMIIGRN